MFKNKNHMTLLPTQNLPEATLHTQNDILILPLVYKALHNHSPTSLPDFIHYHSTGFRLSQTLRYFCFLQVFPLLPESKNIAKKKKKMNHKQNFKIYITLEIFSTSSADYNC